MKIITLWQPWATLIIEGMKTIETREHSKFASLKGQTIGIHAGMKLDEQWIIAGLYMKLEDYHLITNMIDTKQIPLGAILGTAKVVNVGWLNNMHSQMALINCNSVNKYGLKLTDIKKFDNPIIAKGKQGIWNYEI